jgi:hypothetical protein
MSAPVQNVAEALAREIGRVTELRGQYATLLELPNANPRPALFFMDEALEAAKRAAGQNDALAQIRALEELRGFTE